jgi:hypothetical protein
MPSFDRPYPSQYPQERRERRPRRPRWEADDRGAWASRDFGDREELRGRDPFEPREYYERFEEEPYYPREQRAERGYGSFGQGSGGIYGGTPAANRGYPQLGRFAGRGPKGYQRSDERLQEELCERLTADPEIDASELTVSVREGEVTLEGSVADRHMKRDAEDCAEGISGVRQVHNRLRVAPSEGDERSGGGETAAGVTERSGSGAEGQRSSSGSRKAPL